VFNVAVFKEEKPMNVKVFVVVLLGLGLLMSVVTPVFADGIIIPPQPPPCLNGNCPPPIIPRPMSQLNIRYHNVDVQIDQQIAVTHVDQVFYNPNDWLVEGTYLFPLPLDAAVTNFTLWVDGKPVEGKVLDAQEARKTYEGIVRQLRDPALLEYVDHGAFQANIFPIPPKGERRIELKYSQTLEAENGLVKYTYPLNTEKFSKAPLESVRVSVKVKSAQPVRAVYSPSHAIAVERSNDRQFTATYEASQVLPDIDFALYYSIGESEAFHLLTYRNPSDALDPDGYFMLLLAPQPGERETVVSKDVLLVLDRSGSMDGEKFRQAQTAMQFILGHLNENDRFFLLNFSSGIEKYADELRPAGEAKEAAAWVDRLSAAGSTDINRALLEAAAVVDKERPTYLIFMTDGLPTEGEKNSQRILDNFTKAAPQNLRLFAFGVGYDVDTYLLDSLTQAHHGLSTYVKPGEKLDEILSGFYARISTPVLTNLSINFGGLPIYDLYPSPLPDLFEGSQVVLVGRYRKGGVFNVTLDGNINNKPKEFRYPEQKFIEESLVGDGVQSSLPRIWATRKIGYLLSKIRLSGPDKETIDQIIRLSIRYGIVTPYTSYLVTEPMPLGAANQDRLSEQVLSQMQSTAPAAPSGRAAVEKSAGEGALSQADAAPSAPQEQQTMVRFVGEWTFVLKDGVWMDTRYDPAKMNPSRIPFLSEVYFNLAQTRPDLAGVLALGQRVIIIVDGKALEIVDEGGIADPIQLSTRQAPTTGVKPSQQYPSQTPLSPVSQKQKELPQSSICPNAVMMLGFLMVIKLLLRF
jgi:Ca-activated chloride channel homolog